MMNKSDLGKLVPKYLITSFAFSNESFIKQIKILLFDCLILLFRLSKLFFSRPSLNNLNFHP